MLKSFAAYAAVFGCILLAAAVLVHFLMEHEYRIAQQGRAQIMLHQGEEALERVHPPVPIAPTLATVVTGPDEGLAWLDARGNIEAARGNTALENAYVATAPLREGGVNGTLRATVSNTRVTAALWSLDLGLAIVTLIAMIAGAAVITLLSARAMANVQAALQRVYRFTGDAAHELRTPLAVIANNADAVAIESADEATRKQSLANIRAAALQMRELMDGLLILARADEAVVSDLHVIDVGACVRTVADLYRAQAAERGLAFRVREQQPAQTVYGQPEQVARIVGNLVENALRYTPSGGSVEVACYAERGTAIIEVSDNGIGIDAAVIERIFDRFWRGQGSPSGGSGLGLAIAQALAHAHGGEVRVRSRAGAGSTFSVRLPLRPTVAPAGSLSTIS